MSYGESPSSLQKEVPAEEVPIMCERPDLAICQVVDGKLCLPKDVRQTFLGCPIWGGEWRALLAQFDKDWNGQIGSDELQTPAQKRGGDDGGEEQTPPDPSPPRSPFIIGEPATLEKVKEKYGDITSKMPLADSGCALALVSGPTGPALFVIAKEATCLRQVDGPIISHGAGPGSLESRR